MSKVTVTHPYVSAQPDNGDPDQVSSSEWNAAHTLAGVIYENDKTINADYTIPAAKNSLSAGPITIADGVTVTIESGAEWVIL